MRKLNNIFLIIEGPDNVGKTTLINNIKNHFNNYTFHTLHYSAVNHLSKAEGIAHSKSTYNELFNLLTCASTFNNSGIICDRAHLGEMVYGPIYRDYSGEYVLDIERRFMHDEFWNNLFLITCIDEPENLIDREDGESFSTDLDIKKTEIINFIGAHNKSLINNKLLLNIKNYDATAAKNRVITFIESIE